MEGRAACGAAAGAAIAQPSSGGVEFPADMPPKRNPRRAKEERREGRGLGSNVPVQSSEAAQPVETTELEASFSIGHGGSIAEDRQMVEAMLVAGGVETVSGVGTGQLAPHYYYEELNSSFTARLRNPAPKSPSRGAIQLASRWCSATRGPVAAGSSVWMQLGDRCAYFPSLVSHHDGVRLHSLGLGNFPPASRTFFQHQSVEECGTSAAPVRSVWCVLEHDRKKLHVYLMDSEAVPEPERDGRPERFRPREAYRLEFFYQNVYDVVGDLEEDGSAHLYLLLQCPPAVWKARLPEEPGRETRPRPAETFRSEWRPIEQERLEIKNWWRVRSMAEVPQDVLANSNAIRLSFHPVQRPVTGSGSDFLPLHRLRMVDMARQWPEESGANLAYQVLSRLLRSGVVAAPRFAAIYVDTRLSSDFLRHNFLLTYPQLKTKLWDVARVYFGESGSERYDFPMAYLVDALLSRGFGATDALVLELLGQLVEGKTELSCAFVHLLHQERQKHRDVAEEAMEHLLLALDSHRNLHLSTALHKLCRGHEAGLGDEDGEAAPVPEEEEEETEADRAFRLAQADTQTGGPAGKGSKFRSRFERMLPGSMLLRKMVVTPLRVVLMPREMMMGNRVLRSADFVGEEVAVRCVFRCEDGAGLLPHEADDLGDCKALEEERSLPEDQRAVRFPRPEGLPRPLFEHVVINTMLHGHPAGGRHFHFLAWSNSQMREHSIYLFAVTRPPDNAQPRSIKEIRRSMGTFEKIPTVAKRMARLAQCFTQSQEVFELTKKHFEVAVDVEGRENPNGGGPYIFSDGIGRMPRALAQRISRQLQLRHTPSAFQIRHSGFKGMLSVDPRLDKGNPDKVIFRHSMNKFPSASFRLEVVKHAQPSAVYLNRPLITILDQVSQKQDPHAHATVCQRLQEMLEGELLTYADMLVREEDCARELETRCATGLGVAELHQAGLSLTTEPLFRSLLLAIHQFQVTMNLSKMKMEVGQRLGRTMYGIMDETQTLTYGQVFIQYSRTVHSPGSEKDIVEGRVMVTKNPCTVPGDVRLLEAVDNPALHHHYDVIVFPGQGERPHPDEMAGSDLDGDEYAVFWDPRLMFVENERPMDFPRQQMRKKTTGQRISEQDIADFFVKHMKQDMVGQMATAHLVAADRLGLYSTLCEQIAEKSTLAVDFPKSGAPAERLDNDERQFLYPDFCHNARKPAYRSRRLLGKLWRKVNRVENVLWSESQRRAALGPAAVVRDVDLDAEGWEEHSEWARAARDRYNASLRTLLDTYGIEEEAQLVSGHICTFRARISLKERDDFSQFSTDKMAEMRFRKLLKAFRKEWLERSGMWELIVREEEVEERGWDKAEAALLARPTDRACQVAVAMYRVTYGDAELAPGTPAFLSFPWLAHEALALVKKHKVMGSQALRLDPIRANFHDALDLWAASDDGRAETTTALTEGGDLAALLCERYEDLAPLAGLLLRWAKAEGAVGADGRTQASAAAFLRLFADFGRGRLSEWEDGPALADFDAEELPSLEEVRQWNEEDERRLRVGRRRGELALGFLRFLGLDSFGQRARAGLGPAATCRLSEAGFLSWHHVCLSGSFAALRLGEERATGEGSWDHSEMEPFMIAVTRTEDRGVNEKNIRDWIPTEKLRRWSGVSQVALRKVKNFKSGANVLVIAAGSIRAQHRLRSICMTPDLRGAMGRNECPASEEWELVRAEEAPPPLGLPQERAASAPAPTGPTRGRGFYGLPGQTHSPSATPTSSAYGTPSGTPSSQAWGTPIGGSPSSATPTSQV